MYYLETRVAYLERTLQSHGISFTPPENFTQTPKLKDNAQAANGSTGLQKAPSPQSDQQESEKLNNLVSHASVVAVQGTSDSRFLGSTAGISFARVVFAAVKSSMSGAPSERGGVKPSKPLPAGTSSMRDSFFGLQTKPIYKQAPFPSKELGLRLVELYFEHANPQIPILHRPEFMAIFNRVYSSPDESRSARESYMLNIVFAIGAGIIVGKDPEKDQKSSKVEPGSPRSQKRRKFADEQRQPEEYHSSAIVHLENFLSASSAIDRPFEINGALEELQAILLLAGFALLRPVAPGLWYIIGVAVRLAIDMGLHQEDASSSVAPLVSGDATGANGEPSAEASDERMDPSASREQGRREYARDFRRRLWWCVYSFDRLVSTCVGRPFGITDEVVTTEFPSLADDRLITPGGVPEPDSENAKPTYKLVAYHYFRLRLLQSEILQVLQSRQSQMARERGINQENPWMHTRLTSPFLRDFDGSFRFWRQDIDRRLLEWKMNAPTRQDTGVQFNPLFLELNYWQAIIMLYRQSLTVPPVLAEELRSTNEDLHSPSMPNIEDREDEDAVFVKVAEAGQKVLKIYRQLHRIHLVNYTFLATHHLFMAGKFHLSDILTHITHFCIGISFLYAVWHSPVVRSHLTLDDVDFTVLAATSVLDDLIEKCPPAEACRDAFVRMSKATIKMGLSAGGFGLQGGFGDHEPAATQSGAPFDVDRPVPLSVDTTLSMPQPQRQMLPKGLSRRQPVFDMDLRDLFSEEETAARPLSRLAYFPHAPIQSQSASYPPQVNPNMPIKRESMSNSTNPLSPQAYQGSGLQGPNAITTAALSSPTSSTIPPPNLAAQQQNAYSLSNQAPYTNFASQIQTQYPMMSPFSDLDFLDNLPLGGDAMGAAGNGMGQALSFQDFDLGLGMGWDGNLPVQSWGDDSGGNLDMFDGFFSAWRNNGNGM